MVIIIRERERETVRERGNYQEACAQAQTENPRGSFIHSQFDFRIFPELF